MPTPVAKSAKVCPKGPCVKTMLGGGDLRDMFVQEFVDLRPVCHRDNVTTLGNDFIRFDARNREYVIAGTVNMADFDVIVVGIPRQNLSGRPP